LRGPEASSTIRRNEEGFRKRELTWGYCSSDANTVTHQSEAAPITPLYLHGAFLVFSIIAITCSGRGARIVIPGRWSMWPLGEKMRDKRTQAKDAVIDGHFIHPFRFLKRTQTTLLAKGIS
jgi:hypothetical protein